MLQASKLLSAVLSSSLDRRVNRKLDLAAFAKPHSPATHLRILRKSVSFPGKTPESLFELR